ncbi:MAG: hypothetical protein HY681_04420 [Chloroflexi bacterium]|nr:hypothetical protein [Chloroflexota bacterium]
MKKIARERVERAARIYASNKDVGAALGVTPSSFARLCRHYGIQTPFGRRYVRMVAGAAPSLIKGSRAWRVWCWCSEEDRLMGGNLRMKVPTLKRKAVLLFSRRILR